MCQSSIVCFDFFGNVNRILLYHRSYFFFSARSLNKCFGCNLLVVAILLCLTIMRSNTRSQIKFIGYNPSKRQVHRKMETQSHESAMRMQINRPPKLYISYGDVLFKQGRRYLESISTVWSLEISEIFTKLDCFLEE